MWLAHQWPRAGVVCLLGCSRCIRGIWPRAQGGPDLSQGQPGGTACVQRSSGVREGCFHSLCIDDRRGLDEAGLRDLGEVIGEVDGNLESGPSMESGQEWTLRVDVCGEPFRTCHTPVATRVS